MFNIHVAAGVLIFDIRFGIWNSYSVTRIFLYIARSTRIRCVQGQHQQDFRPCWHDFFCMFTISFDFRMVLTFTYFMMMVFSWDRTMASVILLPRLNFNASIACLRREGTTVYLHLIMWEVFVCLCSPITHVCLPRLYLK